jgi:uncharacterized membrane protein
VSWAFWLLVTGVLVRYMMAKRQGTRWLSVSWLLPFAGLIASVFLVALGLFYLEQHRPVEGFTEMYAEYSRILLYTGGGFLLYSAMMVYFSIAGGRSKPN